jgi:hypothetical protein
MRRTSLLREQDLGKPQRGEKVFSQALEGGGLRAVRATIASQHDRRFDGDQRVPELSAMSVDVDRRGGGLDSTCSGLPDTIRPA